MRCWSLRSGVRSCLDPWAAARHAGKRGASVACVSSTPVSRRRSHAACTRAPHTLCLRSRRSRRQTLLTEKAHLPVALVAVLAQEGAVLLRVQPGLEDMVAVGARGAQLARLPLEHCRAHLAVVLVGAGIPALGLFPGVGKGAGRPVVHEPLCRCITAASGEQHSKCESWIHAPTRNAQLSSANNCHPSC